MFKHYWECFKVVLSHLWNTTATSLERNVLAMWRGVWVQHYENDLFHNNVLGCYSCYSFKIVCNWIFYSVDIAWPEMIKIAQFVMKKWWKSRLICYAKNAKNHDIFVEGFWPEFYARGRFMKYLWCPKTRRALHQKYWKREKIIRIGA